MKTTVLLVFFIELVLADPQIVCLNNYSTDSTNKVVAVEKGGRIYLASNDDASLLQKIKVQTGNSVFTLDQMVVVNGIYLESNQLMVTSTLDAVTAASVTGYLYATTAIQALDQTFEVTVVTGPQSFFRNGAKSTFVVLNTQFKTIHFPPFDAPQKTTYVHGVSQDTNTELNFHYGYPGDNWISFTENQFFENPQYVDNFDSFGKVYNRTKILFDLIEPIQVNLPYWYITANGPFNIKFDSTYNNLHTRNTTNVTTTGAFVLTDVYQDQFVNFVTDPTRSGSTGVLITTDLQYQVNLTFSNGQSNSFQSYGPGKIAHVQIVSDMVSKTMTIHANALKPGSFYCQYFVYTGELLPPTPSPPTQPTQPPPTTPTIATTTKSSQSSNIVLTVLLFVCILWEDGIYY